MREADLNASVVRQLRQPFKLDWLDGISLTATNRRKQLVGGVEVHTGVIEGGETASSVSILDGGDHFRGQILFSDANRRQRLIKFEPAAAVGGGDKDGAAGSHSRQLPPPARYVIYEVEVPKMKNHVMEGQPAADGDSYPDGVPSGVSEPGPPPEQRMEDEQRSQQHRQQQSLTSGDRGGADSGGALPPPPSVSSRLLLSDPDSGSSGSSSSPLLYDSYNGYGISSAAGSTDASAAVSQTAAAAPRRRLLQSQFYTNGSQPVAWVDVLVLYTPSARNMAGGRMTTGQPIVEELIIMAVAAANEAYMHSDVHMQLNIVRMAEVNYTESGWDMATSLQDLTFKGESRAAMDEVGTLIVFDKMGLPGQCSSCMHTAVRMCECGSSCSRYGVVQR